eukprot:gene52277-9046_t
MDELNGCFAFDVEEGSIHPKYVKKGEGFDRRCMGRCIAKPRKAGCLQVV